MASLIFGRHVYCWFGRRLHLQINRDISVEPLVSSPFVAKVSCKKSNPVTLLVSVCAQGKVHSQISDLIHQRNRLPERLPAHAGSLSCSNTCKTGAKLEMVVNQSSSESNEDDSENESSDDDDFRS